LLYGILEISIDLFGCQCAGGDERARTADPLLAKQVLSQLSYIPWGTANRAISGAAFLIRMRGAGASLRVRRTLLRGRFSDLESLKSGKDRTKTWVRLLVHSIESPTKSSILRGPLKRNGDGFSPRAEPPAGQINDRSHAFGTDTLRDAICDR
jgi:hypothetical protein